MSLPFLLDQCVPLEIAEHLRRAGHDVVAVRDVMPRKSPDPDVIAKAQELGLILLSLNGDFADIVTYPPAAFLGIVAVQLHNHPEVIPRLMAGLDRHFAAHPDALAYAGKLLVVEVHRLRLIG